MSTIKTMRTPQAQIICSFLYPSLYNTSRSIGEISRASTLKTIYARSPLHTSTAEHSRVCVNSRRNYTTTSPRWHGLQATGLRRQTPKALNTMMEEAKIQMGNQDDVGLFPNTFIMPTSRTRPPKPSVFSEPRLRLALEWFRLKYHVLQFARLFIWSKITFPRPKPKLQLRARTTIAKKLHKEMFTAFAACDTAKIAEICCTGTAADLLRRIKDRRKAKRNLEWNLHEYYKVKVISDRPAQLPDLGGETRGLRQIILRFETLQSLAPARETDPPKQKQHEFLVIQQMVVGGQEPEPWKVWGMTTDSNWEESLMEDYEHLVQAARKRREKSLLE